MTHNDTEIVEASFHIDDWQETPYDEPGDGPKQTRATIRKTYRGAIEGSGVAELLTTQGDDGRAYVASERIVGRLGDRDGTFVIQHGGVDDGTSQSTFGQIVPGSGTGALRGIAGRAHEASQGVLTLTLSLPGG